MFFNPKDLVWLHLRKDILPSRQKNKLMTQEEGPFKVLERIGGNAYKLELLGDIHVSTTFNVGDLALYVDEEFENLRANPS